MTDKMKDLIDKAARYYKNKGYAIGFTSPKRGVDLIVFEKGKPNDAIFVGVMDGDKVRSIPLQGFGNSQKAKTRAASLKRGAVKWIDEVEWKGVKRFDAVWVSTETTPACISHIANINI